MRDFIVWAASDLGLTLEFSGSCADEVGVVTAISGDLAPEVRRGAIVVRVDPRYFRPAETDTLLGDATKAREKLGWSPLITAREMCREMVEADYQAARRHALLSAHGLALPVSLAD